MSIPGPDRPDQRSIRQRAGRGCDDLERLAGHFLPGLLLVVGHQGHDLGVGLLAEGLDLLHGGLAVVAGRLRTSRISVCESARIVLTLAACSSVTLELLGDRRVAQGVGAALLELDLLEPLDLLGLEEGRRAVFMASSLIGLLSSCRLVISSSPWRPFELRSGCPASWLARSAVSSAWPSRPGRRRASAPSGRSGLPSRLTAAAAHPAAEPAATLRHRRARQRRDHPERQRPP